MYISTLFVILVVLVLVTLLGHGMWVLIGTVYRALFNASPPPEARTTVQRAPECARCRHTMSKEENRCPRCGLACDSVLAQELADMDATFRQMQRFRKSKTLPFYLFDQVKHALNARRHELDSPTVKPQPPAEEIPSVLPAPPTEETPKPIPDWMRLQEILDSKSAYALAAADRVRIVMCFRQSSKAELERLPLPTQRNLAQVLVQVDLINEALQTLERCLAFHPQHLEAADIALLGARIAADHDRESQSRQFLQKALARTLTPEQQEEVQRIRELWDTSTAPGTRTGRATTSKQGRTHCH